jgi:beta-galactosidase
MEIISINRNWQFHPGDPEVWRWDPPKNWTYRTVDLPHDWSIESAHNPENPSGSAGGYFPMGFGWYQKFFDVADSWQGKRVYIEFEGVYMNAECWINGHFLGRHPYGYTSFVYDLTPYLKFGEQNTLLVGVDNTHQINCRWYSGSGIYRPVWLLIADPVHVAHWGVFVTTPEISEQAARVHVQTTIENLADTKCRVNLINRILAADQTVINAAEESTWLQPGESKQIPQDIWVSDANLWSPDSPYQYQLQTELQVERSKVDVHTTSFGIRSLSFTAEKGLQINGQAIKLKGGCVHHDNGILGAASYWRSEERKVEVLKASGYNAIRCAHNPPAPAFLDACDRLGMLVIDESFDCWREGKNLGDYHVAFDDWWQRDLESMLYRDRNHPSIILWSIGNELVERNKPEGVQLGRMQAELVRAIDPTRPVIAAINDGGQAWHWEDTDDLHAVLDVSGYNYQVKHYASDHVRLPKRMIIGTESTPGEAFDHWLMVKNNPYILGDFVWTSLDYLGEAGIGRVHYDPPGAPFLGNYPWHQANCGDLDLCGFKRPQSYYRDVLWERGQKVYLVVHTPIPEDKVPSMTYWGWPRVWPNWNWHGRIGKVFQVDVYSSCDRVELFLNDESYGVKPTGVAERFIASYEVPYFPGKLKAIGYQNGKIVEETFLETASAPARIQLIPDRNPFTTAEGDLCFVKVEVTDEYGQVHPQASHDIFFTIQGPGRILAVGSGNPQSAEKYTGHQRKAYHGVCLVAIKSNEQPGDIHFHANADGLEGAEVVIRVEDL